MIVGEASGDLHASRLMRSLRQYDAKAEFRFFGGDLMKAEGGTLVRHYRDLAYMGFIPVLLHLPTIFKNMSFCKRDIVEWKADVVILVDYPGFNLDIAKFLHKNTSIPVYYYISPKIWAWKEWRVKSIKRDVSEMFSILPFEVAFYERRHHYPIHYVGNPTAEEVRTFKDGYSETKEEFCRRNGLEPSKPIIALLAGSRKQEIKDNLPAMLASVKAVAADYQCVLACAPSIDDSYYRKVIGQGSVLMVHDDTYPLLAHSAGALVTRPRLRRPCLMCRRWCATRRLCLKSSGGDSTTSSSATISALSISLPTRRWCPSFSPTASASTTSSGTFLPSCPAPPTVKRCSLVMRL